MLTAPNLLPSLLMWNDGRLTFEDEATYQLNGAEEAFKGSARPRSILFVSWRDLANPLAGGSELLIHQLATGLTQRGYEVSLLCGGPVEQHSLYRVVEFRGTVFAVLAGPLALPPIVSISRSGR